MYTIDRTANHIRPGYKLLVNVFDSPEEFGNYHKTNVGSNWDECYEKSWGGGYSMDNAQILIDGSIKNLAAAQDIVSKLDVSDLLTNSVPMLTPSFSGFVPDIGGYLAGQPECMLTIEDSEQESVNSPIRIFIETTVSSAVTHKQLVARGVATLAFAIAMNTVRPVELYTISVIEDDSRRGTFGHVVKVSSATLDLGRAVFMLTEPGFARALLFPDVSYMAKKLARMGPWPFHSDPTRDNYTTEMRKLLDMTDQDVYLKGGYLFDHEMLNDPVKWVNKMVRKHSKEKVD